MKNAKWLIWVVGLLVWGFAGQGLSHAEVPSLENLSKLVIMENGRIKPLDTFAQNILKQLSGQSKFQKESALRWLARVLFNPQVAYDNKVFLVNNPEVLDAVGVERRGKARDRYSFSQLEGGLPKLRSLAIKASRIEDKDRSFIENEIIALYNKLYIYQQLAASFDFLFAHPDFTINNDETYRILELPVDRDRFSFFEFAGIKDKIEDFIASLKDKDADQRSAAAGEILELSRRLDHWPGAHRKLPLTILPPGQRGKAGEEKWLSPWDLASAAIAHGSIEMPQELNLMRDIVQAYRENNQEKFDKTVTTLNEMVLAQSGNRIRPAAISLEVFYNRLDPFYKGKFFYGFSALFLLLSFIVLKKWFYRFGFVLLSAGFLLHLFGILARMYIRLRPPVTNLYETFIFTGLMTALLGMVLEFFKKRHIGILTGSVAGLVMLMIAGKYAMEGDTMGMLVAVLDSNFWLTVHVITITLGYSGIVLSGFIGHVYVLQKIFKPGKKELLQNTFQAVYAIQAFGIIFTFLGTVLGGIWADQSWGRFWGWDPKENGALLILLWSAILFHARLANWIKKTGMAFGTIVGVIAVALAWFGVNLLGVGLHSYGFTSGIARTLFIFIIFELLFIIVGLTILKAGKNRVKV